MMSSPEKHTDAYLEEICKRFREKKIASTKGLSWGQFLDSQNQGLQVGLYGTLAAAIAIKTKNANRSIEAQDVEQELITYWSHRNNGEEKDNLCQNVRLAALLLGLCFHSQGNSAAVNEITSELERRFSDLDDLWGESSSLPPNAAPNSEWSSAVIIVFAFQAMKHYGGNVADFGNLGDRLTRGANALQKAYLQDSTRKRSDLLVILIAVVLVLGGNAHKAIRKRLSVELLDLDSIFQRSLFYVDYLAHSGECKRDFFLLPIQLLVPVLLLQPTIGGGLYLRAVNAVKQIKGNLDSNDSGLFREPWGRPSTLEQALAVLALDAFRGHSDRSSHSLFLARLWLGAQKKREPEWLFGWFILLFAYLPLGIAVCAEGILGSIGSKLPVLLQGLLSAAQLIPAWVHSAVLVAFSAVRQPIDVAKALIGKGTR